VVWVAFTLKPLCPVSGFGGGGGGLRSKRQREGGREGGRQRTHEEEEFGWVRSERRKRSFSHPSLTIPGLLLACDARPLPPGPPRAAGTNVWLLSAAVG